MVKFRHIISFILLLLLFSACRKNVAIDLPEVEQDIVVEGTIETNRPPFVILQKTQGFFEETSAQSILNNFISGADVSITTNGVTYSLTEVCSNNIPDSLIFQVSGATGIDSASLVDFNYCFYTSFDPALLGVENQQYNLQIIAEGKTLSAQTYIPASVPLDSLWFKTNPESDSLGLIYAYVTDPAGVANYYRWYAQRINRHTYGPQKGEIKDDFPVAPFGSSTDDKFFDGLSFEFAASRGEVGNIENQDDEGPEEGLFKTGDTVVIKFATTTRENFLYIRALENQVASAGSPFSAPGNLPFNITGGIGMWTGYAPYYDTLICQ